MLIYLITNNQNGKYYIGKTILPVEERVKLHLAAARLGAAQLFSRAIRKYGSAAFTVEVLAFAKNEVEVNTLEKLWILALDACNPKVGYNMTYGGEGGRHPEEVRKRQGKKGITRSEEFKSHLSKLLKGRVRSPEHCRAISLARKGISYPKQRESLIRGKLLRGPVIRPPLSAEAKKNISEAKKKYFLSISVAQRKLLTSSALDKIKELRASGIRVGGR